MTFFIMLYYIILNYYYIIIIKIIIIIITIDSPGQWLWLFPGLQQARQARQKPRMLRLRPPQQSTLAVKLGFQLLSSGLVRPKLEF